MKKGHLVGSAKVATAMPNPMATNPNMKVICVYTYDWTDEDDVRRVRKMLREPGIISEIPFKADNDTHAGLMQIGVTSKSRNTTSDRQTRLARTFGSSRFPVLSSPKLQRLSLTLGDRS